MSQSRNVKQVSVPVGIALGIVISIAISISLTAIFASLLLKEVLGQNQIALSVAIITFISSACGALLATKLTKQRILLVCLCCAFGYYLIALSATALFFDGQYSGIIMNLISILLGSVGIAIMGITKKKPAKKKIRRSAYR